MAYHTELYYIYCCLSIHGVPPVVVADSECHKLVTITVEHIQKAIIVSDGQVHLSLGQTIGYLNFL